MYLMRMDSAGVCLRQDSGHHNTQLHILAVPVISSAMGELCTLLGFFLVAMGYGHTVSPAFIGKDRRRLLTTILPKALLCVLVN